MWLGHCDIVFTKQISSHFSYESNGSVYFDTKAFDASPDHFYAKMVPEAFGDNKALAEGEGESLHLVWNMNHLFYVGMWEAGRLVKRLAGMGFSSSLYSICLI